MFSPKACTPVIHQSFVGGVVPRQVFEIVAERVGLAEQCAVHGKAAVERRASHEQELRLRQCASRSHRGRDSSTATSRRSCLRGRRRPRAPHSLRRQRQDRPPPHARRRLAVRWRGLHQCPQEIVRFAIRAHAGKPRQDAFQQRGAGARKANDENDSGPSRRAPPPRAASRRRGNTSLDSLELSLIDGDVIGKVRAGAPAAAARTSERPHRSASGRRVPCRVRIPRHSRPIVDSRTREQRAQFLDVIRLRV